MQRTTPGGIDQIRNPPDDESYSVPVIPYDILQKLNFPKGEEHDKIAQGIAKSDKINSETKELSDALKDLQRLMP